MSQFEADARDIVIAIEEAMHRIEAEEHSIADGDLIAESDAILVSSRDPRGIFAEGLDDCGFDDQLLREVLGEEVQAEGASVGVVGGGIESGITRQSIRLEVDARMIEDPTGSRGSRDRLRPIEASVEIEVRDEGPGSAGDERVFDEQQAAVGGLSDSIRLLSCIGDDSNRVRKQGSVTSRVRSRQVVIAAIETGAIIDEGIAQLDVTVEGFDPRDGSKDLGGIVIAAECGRIEFIEARKKRDIVVRDIEQGAVPRGNRRGDSKQRVIHPVPVLQEHGEDTHGNGQRKGEGLAAHPAIDGSHITFEECEVDVGIELGDKASVASVIFDSRETIAGIEWSHESMKALGGGDLEIDIEIESIGPDARGVSRSSVGGQCGPEISVDQ